MSYDSPANELSDGELIDIMHETKGKSFPEFVEYVWKLGYDWGYERGYEDGIDEVD